AVGERSTWRNRAILGKAFEQRERDPACMAAVARHEHDLVADQLDDPAVECRNDVVRGLLELLDQKGELAYRHPLRHCRKAYEIDETDRELHGVGRPRRPRFAESPDRGLYVRPEKVVDHRAQALECFNGTQVFLRDGKLAAARLEDWLLDVDLEKSDGRFRDARQR